jgi:hypothetical protein
LKFADLFSGKEWAFSQLCSPNVFYLPRKRTQQENLSHTLYVFYMQIAWTQRSMLSSTGGFWSQNTRFHGRVIIFITNCYETT